MTNHEVEFTPIFEDMFGKLDKGIRIKAKKELEKLPERNFKREALSGDLAGFYSHHFYKNNYRIIYKKDDKKFIIYAIWIEKRKMGSNDTYKMFKKWLKDNKEYLDY